MKKLTFMNIKTQPLTREEMRNVMAGSGGSGCSCNCGTNEFACCKGGGCTCEPATKQGVCDCAPAGC
jgi:hypothetical protein